MDIDSQLFSYRREYLDKPSTITYLNPCIFSKDLIKPEPDARLIDVPRAQKLHFCHPISKSESFKNIYSKENTCYGKNYTDYQSIDGGQIYYYINEKQRTPYFRPNFVQPADEVNILQQDPMGGIKPMYYRQPIKSIDCAESNRDTYDGCLSWITDSTSHKEDIMSSQMGKMNSQKYNSSFTGYCNWFKV